MSGPLTSISANTRVVRAETAISTEIDGELVALDVTKGVCYGLNRMGTRIWNLIETPRSAQEIADILLADFDVPQETCLGQTLNLLNELAAAELVRQ